MFRGIMWVGALCLAVGIGAADDWPQMLGPGRNSCWNETNILRAFPPEGLKITWRVPVGPGYSGPAVAGGRVFITDYQKREGGGAERVLCLDEQTGNVLWTFENASADYGKFQYNSGPRSTPTVDGDRVYVLGGAGDLYCLDVKTGQQQWKVNLLAQFQAKMPTWGFSAAPLVYGDLVIVPAGGTNSSRIVALSKLTGNEVWRALPGETDIAYSSPIIVKAGGVDQLIDYIPGEVSSLNPQTGQVYWQIPFEGMTSVATPVVAGNKLLCTNFYGGSKLIELAADKPAGQVLWHVHGENELKTEGLHGLLCTPFIKDDHFYGVCSYGQFRCLSLATGARVWESLEPTRENKRWANAFITRNGDAFFLNNDRGELIIADLQPDGYHELSRTQLIKPTSGGAGGRDLGLVNWVQPAYANGHIIIRNDQEILRASLQK